MKLALTGPRDAGLTAQSPLDKVATQFFQLPTVSCLPWACLHSLFLELRTEEVFAGKSFYFVTT